MKSKIKMIAFDLDGTLLTTDKRLTERTRKALEQAVEKGMHIIPATGRPMSGIPQEIIDFPGIRYIVSSNGARVLDMKNRDVLYEETLPVGKAAEILDIFEKYDTLREIYYDGIGYADIDRLEQIEKYQKDPAMQRYICTTRRPVESTRVKFETENRGLDKIQALFVSQEDKLEAWESIESQVGDVEVTGALSNNIEVNAKGIHKGAALQFLGELLGISMDEVITFGDGSNDIKMLEMAGTGVAMANSVQKVLDIADITAMSNDEDGVARIIEQYVLE